MNKIDGLSKVKFKNPTAVCIGNFDGLHTGHRRIISVLKEEAGKKGLPTVIFTFKPHPVKYFGREIALLSTPRKRDELFSYMGADYLVTADFDPVLCSLSPEDFFKEVIAGKLKADIVVVGQGYRFGAEQRGDTALLQKLGDSYGVRCIFVEKVKDETDIPISSTRIRALISEGNVEKAGKFLGRPYSLEGEVVHGDGQGKLFGFPTLNLEVSNELVPLLGVYATETLIKNKIYPSMTYIGKRPTIGNYTQTRVETNVFGFEEDVYGEFTEIFFYAFIRGEAKFRGIEELKEQMGKDKLAAAELLARRRGEI